MKKALSPLLMALLLSCCSDNKTMNVEVEVTPKDGKYQKITKQCKLGEECTLSYQAPSNFFDNKESLYNVYIDTHLKESVPDKCSIRIRVLPRPPQDKTKYNESYNEGEMFSTIEVVKIGQKKIFERSLKRNKNGEYRIEEAGTIKVTIW